MKQSLTKGQLRQIIREELDLMEKKESIKEFSLGGDTIAQIETALSLLPLGLTAFFMIRNNMKIEDAKAKAKAITGKEVKASDEEIQQAVDEQS